MALALRMFLMENKVSDYFLKCPKSWLIILLTNSLPQVVNEITENDNHFGSIAQVSWPSFLQRKTEEIQEKWLSSKTCSFIFFA